MTRRHAGAVVARFGRTGRAPAARGEESPTDAAQVAATVHRLAVLLQAGLPPARAWQHLATAGDAVALQVSGRGAAGGTGDTRAPDGGDSPDGRGPGPAGIAAVGGAWVQVAAAWQVATILGAPLAESLRGIASALRSAQEAADDVQVALAEPVATARLIAWLPLVAIALGLALGFDTVGVVTGNPLGAAAIVLGLLLMIGARLWTRILVRRAQPDGAIPGLDAELMAVALTGGVSIERADAVVTDATGVGRDSETTAVLELSRSAGAPAVELLRGTAELARHRARTEGRMRAARLSSTLLLPLGVCTLPAFLLLGVAPMLLSVLAATPLSL